MSIFLAVIAFGLGVRSSPVLLILVLTLGVAGDELAGGHYWLALIYGVLTQGAYALGLVVRAIRR